MMMVFGLAGSPSAKFLATLNRSVASQLVTDRRTRDRQIQAAYRRLDVLNTERRWLDATDQLRRGAPDPLARLRDQDDALARLATAR